MNVTDPVVSAPASVNMASVPQVSPVFDQFGNAYRSGFDRNMAEMAQQSLSGGIASVAPSRAAEVTQAAKLVKDELVREKLADEVLALINNEAELQKMSAQMAPLGYHDAADLIASEALKLIE